MENEGFFDNGGSRGVAVGTRRWQATLLEEARGQTMSHSPTREFQCQTEDWRVSARGEVFFGEASIGV